MHSSNREKFNPYFYQIIGVSRYATKDEIDSGYWKIVQEIHPDVNSGADDRSRMEELAMIYGTLSDDARRAEYDCWLSERMEEEWKTPLNAGPQYNGSKNRYYDKPRKRTKRTKKNKNVMKNFTAMFGRGHKADFSTRFGKANKAASAAMSLMLLPFKLLYKLASIPWPFFLVPGILLAWFLHSNGGAYEFLHSSLGPDGLLARALQAYARFYGNYFNDNMALAMNIRYIGELVASAVIVFLILLILFRVLKIALYPFANAFDYFAGIAMPSYKKHTAKRNGKGSKKVQAGRGRRQSA